MNTLKELTDQIRKAWQTLQEAVRNEDWLTTQQAFRKLGTLRDLEDQARDLEQRLAEVCSNGPPPSAHLAAVHDTFSTRRGTKRPKDLKIGTTHIPISLNNQIPIATANWILNQGKSLPKIPNFVHPTNSGFASSAQTKRLDDGSFIEIGDSQDTLLQKARKLLNACGFRELKLEVLLDDGTLKTA